jgi:hypothetical protein
VNKYVIDIPNKKSGTYKIVTLLILMLNFFVFGFVFLKTTERSANIVAVTGLAANAIALIYYLLNKRHLKMPFTEVIFFINAGIWLLWGNYLLAFLMIIFSLLSFYANKKLQIIFNEDGIVYPAFPVKKYAWAEVEQVIWKDDILTIDLKNNQLLQFNISKDFAEGFDVPGFNGWCQNKIQRV